jgi:hypothetical protein
MIPLLIEELGHQPPKRRLIVDYQTRWVAHLQLRGDAGSDQRQGLLEQQPTLSFSAAMQISYHLSIIVKARNR